MMIEPPRFVPILEQLRDLLVKHEFLDQADIVARLIDLAHLESPRFARTLQIGGVWGSTGSLADVAYFGDFEGTEEQRRDSIEYRRLLIRLADEMKAQGLTDEGSEFIASALRKGMERRGESPA
jgi:hypothetical protein